MRRDVVCSAAALLLSSALVAPAVAPAQTPQQEMVPLELVEALLIGPFWRGTPDVLVGRLPEALASRLTLPQESRVLGSIASQELSTIAIAVPGTPDSARDVVAANLTAAGWNRFEPPSRGGFESSGYDRGLTFCQGDSVSLGVGAMPNRRGGSYVILTHAVSREFSLCRQPEMREFPGRRGSPIPPLAPPEGSTAWAGGGSGGDDTWETRARIRTKLGVRELLDHYSAQLRQHGWTPLERTATEALAVETFRVTDDNDIAWHGVLVVTTPAPDAQRFASLRVTRVNSPSPS